MNNITNKELLKIQNPMIYSGNELNQVIKKPDDVLIRFAFCFPEVYEIGMSYLGMKILYNILNNRDDTYCERVFAPSIEMEKLMRKNDMELYSLETKNSIKSFDFVGFTLQYELTYTNILNMLDLANIPIYSRDRDITMPFVCAGGPCAYNPEPLSDFIDFYMLGEGEEVVCEVMDIYAKWKKENENNINSKREDFLEEIDKIECIYVPSLYKTQYNKDGTIKSFDRIDGKVKHIKKRIIKDMDKVCFPTKPIVPYTDIVHNRIMLEIFRGCIRGCRFCQAGYIYRPVREKSVDRVLELADENIRNTGHEEISLISLSTSDYTRFNDLASKLIEKTKDMKINLSLPSLRIDSINEELLDKMRSVRKSGLTLAPEAGTQRLRNVINKNVTEEDIFKACDIVFRKGWSTVKLYFMMGLPTETMDDIQGIVDIVYKVVDKYYEVNRGKKFKQVRVNVSVSTFVPKPFTAFQFCSQDSREEINKKIKYLQDKLHGRNISFTWNDPDVSMLEAVIARGNRQICNLIYNAWKLGAKFDGWNEYFNIDIWNKAFELSNIDRKFYSERTREFSEILPWEFIDICVTRKFFEREYLYALNEETTPNCRQSCSNCGASTFEGGVCYE